MKLISTLTLQSVNIIPSSIIFQHCVSAVNFRLQCGDVYGCHRGQDWRAELYVGYMRRHMFSKREICTHRRCCIGCNFKGSAGKYTFYHFISKQNDQTVWSFANYFKLPIDNIKKPMFRENFHEVVIAFCVQRLG